MQGKACVAYAECQHKLGQLEGAVESLETFLQLSHSQVTPTLHGLNVCIAQPGSG